LDAPTLAQLRLLGLEMHSRYRRIAAGGPGPGPVRAGDHATQVDRDLEDALIELIMERFGMAGVVAEERITDGGGILNAHASMRLYLDPIDGTHLFNRGIPGFTSTIGCEISGRLSAGIIYFPTDQLFLIARRGDPVVMAAAGGPLTRDRPAVQPAENVVAVKSSLRKAVPGLERALVAHGFRVENLGSVAGRLAAVARGEISGLVKEVGVTGGVPRLWGIAAGLLLCEDAGVPMFWDSSHHYLAMGDPHIVALLESEQILRGTAAGLDSLWAMLKAIG
jgi:fructose-1,6-bisphosphatase/inositol monophosphatase family enzyme